MKGKNLLILVAVGLVAYWLWKRSKKAVTTATPTSADAKEAAIAVAIQGDAPLTT